MSKLILPVLSALSRFCQTKASLTNDSALLSQLFKSLEPSHQYSFNTGVMIHAGIKCLSQKDWIELQCAHVIEEANRLLLEAQNYDKSGTAEDNELRDILIGQALVKIGVLNHSQIVAAELYARASEYMLKVSGNIVAESGNQFFDKVIINSDKEAERVTARVKDLHDFVDLMIANLETKSRSAVAANAQQRFTDRVQTETLNEVVALAKVIVSRAIGLSDISVSTATMLAGNDDEDSRNRRKWLVAYAMTAATTAAACSKMVDEAFYAYGNSLPQE